MNEKLIMDNVLNMIKQEDLKDREFEELYNENLKKVIQYIYETEDGEIIRKTEKYIEEYSYCDIWETFKDNIYARTGDFLETSAVRHFDEEKKTDFIKNVFEWRYERKEAEDYIIKQLGEEKELIHSILHLFVVCESLIIMQDVSKRRFLIVMTSNLKLSEKTGNNLWKIFNEHRDVLEKKVLYNRISYINSRVNNLEKQIRKLKENIEFICYMSTENDKNEELK